MWSLLDLSLCDVCTFVLKSFMSASVFYFDMVFDMINIIKVSFPIFSFLSSFFPVMSCPRVCLSPLLSQFLKISKYSYFYII